MRVRSAVWPLLLMLASCQPSPVDDDEVATAAPEPSAAPVAVPASPWDAAAARGVALRAVGNEPGWSMEVDRGPAPALRATLDYGERSIEVARAQVLDGDPPGYRGTTADGKVVVVEVMRQTCSDGMSDRVYEARVTLREGDTRYLGCGRFLNPISR